MSRLITSLLVAAGLAFASCAQADCFREAGQRYGVDTALLQAIALVESGFNPKATNTNANGSVDYGLMQINDRAWLGKLKRFGIGKDELLNPCVSVNVAAWILSSNFAQHGRTWKAVGAYNAVSASKQQKYVEKVKYALRSLRVAGAADQIAL